MGNKRKSQPSGRATIYLSNEMKGLLDSVAARRGMTRSEAAIEAIGEWVRRQEEEDFEQSYGLAREIRNQADRLAAMIHEDQIRTYTVLENVREIGTSASRENVEELRRRAYARSRSQSQNSQSAESRSAEASGEE